MVVFYLTLCALSSYGKIFVIFCLELKMKPLKNKISITIDSDLLEELKKEAEKDDRSLSQYINLILKKYMASINYD